MSEVRITIPGTMRGKQRPRFSTAGRFPRAYTPAQTVNTEAWIRCCAANDAGGVKLNGAIGLQIHVGIAVAASWSKKKRDAALSGSLRPTGKPDVDNYCKILCDSLNGIIWHDDAQVVELTISKTYAAEASTTLRAWEVFARSDAAALSESYDRPLLDMFDGDTA